MKDYTINEVKIENLPEVIELVREVFLAFEAPVYSEERNVYFLGGLSEENFKMTCFNESIKFGFFMPKAK